MAGVREVMCPFATTNLSIFPSEKLFLLILLVFTFTCFLSAKKPDGNNLISGITDPKDFRKLLRTKTNVLVLFAKSSRDASSLLKVLQSVSEIIRGEGTLIYVDCESDGKKICKKLKVSPESTILKHYKDGEYHKDYDRKESVQSMVTFMRNPSGDIPWEEDDTTHDVVHISDGMALEKLLSKEIKPVLVMFYAPWCGFCKKLKPDYSSAATEVKNIAILSAMDVNKPENAVVRQHFNITGFPTILYFERGRLRKVYDGENNKDGLVKFIKNPNQVTEKPKEEEWRDTPSDVVHLTDETFSTFLTKESSVLIMFYAPWCGHCKAMKPEFVNAAARLKSEQILGILAAVDATKEPGIASRFGIKGYPTVKYYKDGEFTFDVSFRTADKIVEFMIDPKEPPPPPPPEKPWSETTSSVSHLNNENFKSFLKKKKHALVMFYAPWCGHCKKAKPEFENAALKFQDDLQVAFAAVDCTLHKYLCSIYGVSGYPTMKYFNYLINVSDYDGDRTESSFINFMKNPSSSFKKNAVAPDETFAGLVGAEHLHHLTDNNFSDVIQMQESTVVMFYAPWCGHCTRLKPIFAEAAHKAKSENLKGIFATVDATVEWQLKQRFDIKSYPTVKYFRRGEYVDDYDGQRTVDNLLEFMKNPPKLKDEL